MSLPRCARKTARTRPRPRQQQGDRQTNLQKPLSGRDPELHTKQGGEQARYQGLDELGGSKATGDRQPRHGGVNAIKRQQEPKPRSAAGKPNVVPGS